MEIDAKLQKVANKTAKFIGQLLELPEPEKYVIKLVEENDVEGSVESLEGNVVLTYRVSDEPLSMFFVIAHELRHLYQFLYQREKYSGYSLEELHNFNNYNLQPAEIDANAFAAFLCETVLGVGCPPLEETSEEVMKKIQDRTIEIFHEYYTTDDFDYFKRRIQNNQLFEIYRQSAKKYQ